MPVIPITDPSKDKKEQIKEITEKLEQGIYNVFESDHYKEYLAAASKFHNYSFNNVILIMLQLPTASRVAGYHTWKKEFNRTVKPGEKAIKILAPSPYKRKVYEKQYNADGTPVLDENGNQVVREVDKTFLSYHTVSVFDVSQTDGDPIPELCARELDENVADYEELKQILCDISPVPVHFATPNEDDTLLRGAKGYFSFTDRKIVVSNDMGESQTIKTLVHEIAHSMLHDKADTSLPSETVNATKETKEVQAESVAYTVCNALGIASDDYSFEYIASWSQNKEMKELRSSLDIITKTAGHILDVVEEKQKEQQENKDFMEEYQSVLG